MTDYTDEYLMDNDGDGLDLNLDNYGTLFIEDIKFWNEDKAVIDELLIDDLEDSNAFENTLGLSTGGVGTVTGVVQGIILLQLLENVTVYLGLFGYYQLFFRSLILIGVVVFDVIYIKQANWKLQKQELLQTMQKCLHELGFAKKVARNGREVIRKNKGATEKTINQIATFLRTP